MAIIPGVYQAKNAISDDSQQGSKFNSIVNAIVNPANTSLLTGFDPVIEEISNPNVGTVVTYMPHTVSGTPPLSLPNSAGQPLESWVVDVLPYQEGTGNPSPSNVRPIHGTNKLNLFVEESYDPSATPKAVITFDNTIYGGTYDVVTGTLTLTHKIVDLSTLNWTNGGNLKLFFSIEIRDEIKRPASNVDVYSYGYCDTFTFTSYDIINASTPYKICVSVSGSVGVNDGNQYNNVNEFKTAMSGIHLCYELATPIIFHIDGHTIPTPTGTATTWATAEDGTVDGMEVTYVGKA